MASMTLTATVGTALTASIGNQANDITQSALVKADVAAIDYTDVAAAIAVLVADGASPTEAHVTALNDAWLILKPLIDTAKTDAAALTGGTPDALLYVLSTNMSKNKFLEILRVWQDRVINGSTLLSS